MASTPPTSPDALHRAFASHDRAWRQFTYVYAVISRRSHGLSIGINLNVDQVCNFDCVYCLVQRPPEGFKRNVAPVDLGQLRRELRGMIGCVADGSIWREPEFTGIDDSYRRLNDIAFSGDGEPTAYPSFDEACRLVADTKAEFGLDDAKIVLITNATLLDRPMVRRGLAVLDANQGEIWAKLDAGTQAYYAAVDRTTVPLMTVLTNIADCGRVRPVVIQTMLLTLHGQAMPDAEFNAYADRLRELIAGGCRIERVQLYTVARQTAEAYATALPTPALEERALQLGAVLPGVRIEVYPGIVETPQG